MDQTKPLKLAIVGTGTVTRKNYVPFLAAQPGVELAYWNRTPDKAQSLAMEFGGAMCGSLEALMAWQPTAVLVLTAETVRHGISTRLLALGAKKMFFEKPLVAAQGQAKVTEEDFAQARELL